MSSHADGSYSCTPGIALIAKVLAGKCKLEYTKATAGKGTLEAGENPKDQSEVKEKVMEAKIASVSNPVDGECQVTVQINSTDVETGFYCTGIMLFAKDENGSDVPFTYLVLENEPEWIRPKSSVVGKLATFDLVVAVGDVDHVYASVDPGALVTQNDLTRHNVDPEAHLIEDDTNEGTYYRFGVDSGGVYIQEVEREE